MPSEMSHFCHFSDKYFLSFEAVNCVSNSSYKWPKIETKSLVGQGLKQGLKTVLWLIKGPTNRIENWKLLQEYTVGLSWSSLDVEMLQTWHFKHQMSYLITNFAHLKYMSRYNESQRWKKIIIFA